MNKKYIDFIADLKKNIVQSRYIAARQANKEQLSLYLRTGQMLSESISAENWGAKVIEQIATDLQRQLPGLRGFSYRNLMKIKQFADQYSQTQILPSPTAELLPAYKAQSETFWGITFSHHILLLNRCKTRTPKGNEGNPAGCK